MKYELQNLIQGKGGNRTTNSIQKITRYLRAGQEASSKAEGVEYSREQEEESLVRYVDENSLWYTGIVSEHNKIGEGAEQKVYYDSQRGVVVKTNDAIFYAKWIDYFNSLIIHNYLFPDTAYTIVGFRKVDGTLFVVVEQSHIVSTEYTDLEIVREFLEWNGFKNTRRNDYYNEDLGIILEDLHDENVIISNKIPFFVDTVFYLTEAFYNTK